MKRNKKSYGCGFRMPDGTITQDVKKMTQAWEKIYKPICKEMKMKVIDFDPGILFNYGNDTVNIPTELAIKIRDLILELRHFRALRE
jgi:hypothetical protein